MSIILDEHGPVSTSPSRTDVTVAPRLTSRTPETSRRRRAPTRELQPQPDEPSLGELKARHRELHLCVRCTHHVVCGMAKALDANLLVTIVTCLGFEPAEAEGSSPVCELLPVEPLPDDITEPADDSASAAARRDPP